MSTVDQNARWQRLEQLFAAAADLPRDRQDALVDREAASDPELAEQLRALLHCDTGARERITRAVDGATKVAAVSLDWTGRRIGPYRIMREIGRGGMGIVFEAV